MKKKQLSKKKYLDLFPNSFITPAETLKLDEKDADSYYENPVCMNFNCRSKDIDYVGENQTYEVDVYQCRECDTISVQGYETTRTGGNVGCEIDLEDIHY